MSAPIAQEESEASRTAAAAGLARLRGTASDQQEWGPIAARRYVLLRIGTDLSYADALFEQATFGPGPGDAARYDERLDACADGRIPPRETW